MSNSGMPVSDASEPGNVISFPAARLVFSPLSPALRALLSATELTPDMERGFALMDVGGVESFWEIIDTDSTAHGFVLRLRTGRRVYLQYILDQSRPEPADEVQILPMRRERYPHLRGGSIDWNDDADALNGFLRT